jgi:Tol biopolymer transport system component
MAAPLIVRLAFALAFLLVLLMGGAVLVGRALPADTLLYEAEGVERHLDLYLLHIPSRLRINLTQHPATDFAPAASPDGHRIAYVSDRDGANHIFVLDLWTRQSVNLTPEGCIPGCFAPVWMPDGQKLTFSTYPAPALRYQIHMKDLISGETKVFHPSENPEYLWSWSPDGTQFAVAALTRSTGYYDYDSDIVNAETGKTMLYLKQANSPVWSPDGQSLAYASSIGGNRDLYLLNLSTGESRQLTRMVGDEFTPAWSPDGKRLAFGHDQNAGQAGYAIYLLNLETLETEQIVAAHSAFPRWLP